MDPTRWLMQAKRWAQNPPTARKVIFALAIIAASLAVAGIEWLYGWPDWLTVNRLRP